MTLMFILGPDGEPIAEPDAVTWGRWYQTADTSIAHDMINFQ